MTLLLTPRRHTLELNVAIEEARRFGADCQRISRSLIQYVNSESAARDMDRIREELGEDTLTYVGFSYGTFLGATYAEFFPERVRALLLDAGMNPAATPEEDVVQQAMGFEVALDSFFAVCASDPDCPFKAPDLEAAFNQILATADVTPLAGWAFPIEKNDILVATFQSLYSREANWLLLAEAMRQALDGSGVGFGVLLTGIDTGEDDDAEVDFTNPYEAFIAIACVDFWSLEASSTSGRRSRMQRLRLRTSESSSPTTRCPASSGRVPSAACRASTQQRRPILSS